MIVVLVVASGAAWEGRALTVLGAHPGVVVLKRCVDVDDLLAAASSGQAQAAVVGIGAPGLDAAAVALLRRHGVRPVGVVPDDRADVGRARAVRVGITSVVTESGLAALPDLLAATEPAAPAPAPTDGAPGHLAAPAEPGPGAVAPRGRALAVWGPAGAPGRTTVAVSVAAELARRGRRTVLVDADPYGGAVAQVLGVLDEVSGLLAAARLATAGELTARFASVQRALDPRLSLVTGLPRADRWVEVRPGTVEQVLEAAAGEGDVVVDTGFCLEDDLALDAGARPTRNQLTLAALEGADEVLAVGGADPVGLSRLARGLVELRELVPTTPVRVVVNRMRGTLGWAERDVTAMVAGFAPVQSVHFLPDDRTAVDRALVAGRTLLEAGESPLTRAVADVVDALAPR